jgi:cysteine desulfurase/selenocysteine lyase
MIDNDQLGALREATPGLAASLHLNHAGASLMPRAAMDAINEHLLLETRMGPMDAAAAVGPRLDGMRASAARLLNAHANEIAFATSGSAAFGALFAALPALRAGDRILVGRQEWGGNLATYERAAQRAGARVEVIPCREDGSVDAEALAARLDDTVRLVSLTWLPANGGLINDAAAIGQLTRAAGVPYFIDAAQAVGQIPVDVRMLHCDMLKAAGRKHLRGPRGTALLYVRREFLDQLEPPWVDVLSAPWSANGPMLRDDARRFETSEAPVALLLGLARSIELALEVGIDAIAERVQRLAVRLRERLAEVPTLRLRDLGRGIKSGLVSFTLDGRDAFAVKTALASEGIRVGANGVAYTPLDMQVRGLDSVVRVSLSYLNSEEDIETLATALESAIDRT